MSIGIRFIDKYMTNNSSARIRHSDIEIMFVIIIETIVIHIDCLWTQCIYFYQNYKETYGFPNTLPFATQCCTYFYLFSIEMCAYGFLKMKNRNKLKLLKVTAHFFEIFLKREVLKRVQLIFHFFLFILKIRWKCHFT